MLAELDVFENYFFERIFLFCHHGKTVEWV